MMARLDSTIDNNPTSWLVNTEWFPTQIKIYDRQKGRRSMVTTIAKNAVLKTPIPSLFSSSLKINTGFWDFVSWLPTCGWLESPTKASSQVSNFHQSVSVQWSWKLGNQKPNNILSGHMHWICQVIIIKWVPENLCTFSIASQIVNEYKFSRTHFIV